MHEAMITAAWLAAHTDRLVVGHLVLCDSLRHPAVLAKQAVTIDHASRGRFELGIGWGSVPDELDAYGVGDTAPSAPVRRLAESLEVITALWGGETVDFEGEFHRVKGARQLPGALARIPLLIGGAGRRTLALVARYADWWNLPIYALERLEELRPAAGGARVSIQQLVAFVPNEADRDRVTELARRRFGIYGNGLVIGDAAQLVDHFTALHDRGVEVLHLVLGLRRPGDAGRLRRRRDRDPGARGGRDLGPDARPGPELLPGDHPAVPGGRGAVDQVRSWPTTWRASIVAGGAGGGAGLDGVPGARGARRRHVVGRAPGRPGDRRRGVRAHGVAGGRCTPPTSSPVPWRVGDARAAGRGAARHRER